MLFSVSVFADADYSGFTNQIVKEHATDTTAMGYLRQEKPSQKTKDSRNELWLSVNRVSATRLIIQFGGGVSTAEDKFLATVSGIVEATGVLDVRSS